MKITYEFEKQEVEVLMTYIDSVLKHEGLAQAENALHLAKIFKLGYDAQVKDD